MFFDFDMEHKSVFHAYLIKPHFTMFNQNIMSSKFITIVDNMYTLSFICSIWVITISYFKVRLGVLLDVIIKEERKAYILQQPLCSSDVRAYSVLWPSHFLNPILYFSLLSICQLYLQKKVITITPPPPPLGIIRTFC